MQENDNDIIGKVFRELTILAELTKEEKEENNYGWRRYYWCQCSCGNKIAAQGSAVKSGHKKSCGCLNKKRDPNTNNSHIGEKHGKLTIVGWHYQKRMVKKEERTEAVYDCLCECGNICKSTYSKLKNNKKVSCDSCSKQRRKEWRKSQRIEMVRKKFGRLTVLREMEQRDSIGAIQWECECDCGEKTIVSGYSLRSGNTSSCGCQTSFGEQIIAYNLKMVGISFKPQYHFDDLVSVNNVPYRFDFGVLDENRKLKYLIEYDGEQHFKYRNHGWATEDILKNTQRRDHQKNQYCFNHNIPIIRIPYTHFKDITIDDLLIETSPFLLTPDKEEQYINQFN